MKRRLAEVTLSVLAVMCVAIAPAVPASAQGTPATPAVLHNPHVNLPVTFDISPPLRDMAKHAAPQAAAEQEATSVLRPKLDHLMQADYPCLESEMHRHYLCTNK